MMSFCLCSSTLVPRWLSTFLAAQEVAEKPRYDMSGPMAQEAYKRRNASRRLGTASCYEASLAFPIFLTVALSLSY